MKLVAIRLNALARERNDLTDHHARHVGDFAERRIAHHIEIGEPRKAVCRADAMPARTFDIQKNFRRVRQFISEEKRIDFRGIVFRGSLQAVFTAIGRGESGMPLQDHVGLPGNPVAARVGMRKQSYRFLFCGIIGGAPGDRLRRLCLLR